MGDAPHAAGRAVFVAPRRWPKHVEGAFEIEM
jgi:hypothetical protein